MASQARPLREKAVKSITKVVTGILFGLGAILVFALLAFSFIISWIAEADTTRELSRAGKWVDGTVVNIVRGKESTTLTYIYYAPGADGTTQKYQSLTHNNRYLEGATVRVVYSSRQPGIALIEDDYFYKQDTSAVGFLNRNSSIALIILTFFIIGAYLLITNLLQLRPALAVDRDGICTRGTVLRLEDVESYASKGGRSHAYYVNYQYRVMGQSYKLREKISKIRYDQLESDMPVVVRYLPDRPDLARLEK
jgi:hypothetical protein